MSCWRPKNCDFPCEAKHNSTGPQDSKRSKRRREGKKRRVLKDQKTQYSGVYHAGDKKKAGEK